MTVTTAGDAYFDRDLGQYLKECRLAAGWSQTQVAELLGVTFQQIQKYERGLNRLPANRFPKLAQAIGFDPSGLLLGTAPRADRGQLELMALFRDMSAQQQGQLIEIARELVRKAAPER